VSLRVKLLAADPIRRHGLAAMLSESGHLVVADSPDVVLFDSGPAAALPPEAEAPVVALTDRIPSDPPAGVLPRDVGAGWLDMALRAAAAGLLVRAPGFASELAGFAAAPEESPLTPRETEILTLVARGLSNKAVARRLNISVHTVKFHLEALFARLGVTNRAEAVAKGLMGGAIEL
jgi:DNA-binding CsgD family transcriptional regulator